MEIVLAEEMGFCQGVRRAIEMAEQAVREGEVVRTLGELVHNPQVVERLERLGIRVVGGLEEVGPGEVALVTAHGAAPAVFAEAERRGIPLLDATCPLVERVQRLAQEMAQAGYGVLICGDPGHAEVRGILGYAGRGAAAGRTLEELRAFARAQGLEEPWEGHHRLAVLFQTTQREQVYRNFVVELVQAVPPRIREVRIWNTVCAAVARREPAARRLARSVDAVVVVGGRQSANTRHLAETCAAEGVPTYSIERADELRPEWFIGKHRVGVTAGTSTPDETVAEVVERLRVITAF
ncbi:MAG: 4-hydroxy-3-methylbut-2-enyl diphosphate reductase [Chloroflexia bacterium]